MSGSKASAAKLTGIVNGRPRFDFGDTAPPAWLLERIERATIDGGVLILRDGTKLAAGEWLRA